MEQVLKQWYQRHRGLAVVLAKRDRTIPPLQPPRVLWEVFALLRAPSASNGAVIHECWQRGSRVFKFRLGAYDLTLPAGWNQELVLEKAYWWWLSSRSCYSTPLGGLFSTWSTPRNKRRNFFFKGKLSEEKYQAAA